MACLLLLVVAALVVLAPAAHGWDFAYPPCKSLSCPDPSSKCDTATCSKPDGAGVLAHWQIPNTKVDTKACGYQDDNVNFQKSMGPKCGGVTVDTPGHCCTECANTVGCVYWQFVQIDSSCGCGLCYFTSTKPKCANTYSEYEEPASWVGGKCNPKITGDPHLTGAHGTHFDFVGEADRSFCVVSDKNLHINAGLSGYSSPDLKDAVLIKDGKSVHTWIRELGLIWTHETVEHTLKLVARSSPQVARGGGFLKGAEMDGEELKAPSLGEELSLPGGLKFKFVNRTRKGKFEVDVFNVLIGNLLDMEVNLRVAEPRLRTATDAYAHIETTFKTIKKTEAIHGVLGQTYRDEPKREQRAAAFTKLVKQLHAAHVAADADNGNNFLDGKTTNYMSSTILSTDCHFSSFGAKTLPMVASQ